MAVAIDAPYLGAYLSFPETTLQTLLSDPTADLVHSLLRQISVKAKEHEQTRADQLKLEVELENVVRTSETKARAQKVAVDKNAGELAALRQKLSQEESARTRVESELQNMKGSISTSDHDASTLKARISSLEGSNRDTLALIESKTTALDNASNDLISKQEKINELRAELSRLEQAAQAAHSASTTAKLREQTHQQEIDMLRRNNDWLESELKTKSSEYTKFRKEKNALISELQRQNEDMTAQIESQQRTESSLHSRIQETTEKIDQLLVQIKDLREEADKNEESHRAELHSANRLAKLMEESRDTEKARRQDLDSQLDQVKDDAAEELGRIAAEIETEHGERVAAEDRISDLEEQLEQLRSQNHVQPSTPKNGRPDSRRGTPGLEATPSKRGGPNLTQMVTDYHAIKSELDAEKRRSAELRKTIDEMLHDIEARQPEIAEMQADHARMEKDMLEMSNYAEKMAQDSEEAKKNAKTWKAQSDGAARENEIVRQQLRDSSSQVKILLMEVNSQSDGSAPFTADQRAQLERIAHGDFDSDMAEDVTDTSRYISEHLTTFRNTAELVEQNEKLLRLTRELGEKMEGEEAQAQRSEATQNLEELMDLRRKYERCKDEIASLMTQSESYITERDMFRRMLSHRGQLPRMSEAGVNFNESANGLPPGTPTSNYAASQIGQSPNAKDIEDHRKLLKEMQAHFDNYKRESASERTALKSQLDDTNTKAVELRNELSKKVGELTLANERYDMLQGNFKMLKLENSELQKRSTAMSERASKQDLRAQQVAEELIESKGMMESMRNETANLKAEKEFWKSVEARFTTDNASLQADRDRLNTMNASLQSLLNDREHADSEGRRRLQSEVEAQENEIKTLKRKLQEEQEEHKRLVMRREHDVSQTQSRTDDLLSSLSTTREELAAAKTARDHLQTRVDELTIELRSANEKVGVLQLKPSTAGAPSEAPQTTNGTMSEEQELAMQVSELKKNLDLAQAELTSTRQEVEQYKAISSASEEELRNFNETQEQFRLEMDKVAEEKENRIKALEQDLETLRTEFTARNAELNELQTASLHFEHRLEEQKASYETEMKKVNDLRERAESAAQYHQQDLKSQAEIAQNAQQNYENELVKHGEAAKTLQTIRHDYHDLKLQNMDIVARAETAETKLAHNHESWAEAKDRYERELTDMRIRREDVSKQNKLLHEQLESLSKQIEGLRHSTTGAGEGTEEAVSSSSSSADVARLQELIRYLRQEKEIVEVKQDIAIKDAQRLRQQLDHIQPQLDEMRLKLAQQQRSAETSELHATSQKKLIATIEELNLNRESNSTLRTEKVQLQSSLNEKSQEIEELQNRISPLQARISELEDQHEALEQDLRMTQEARARFEQRYLDVLNRSNSIDPAELEKLQEQIKTMDSERDHLSKEKADLQSQVDAIPARIKENLEEATKNFQETRKKLVEQSKARDAAQKVKINEKDSSLQEALQEREQLKSKLQELQAELDKAHEEHAAELSRVQESQAKQPDQSSADNGQSTIATSADPTQLQELQKRTEAAETQRASADAKVKELEERIASTQRELEEAKALIAKLQTEQSSASQKSPSTNESAEEIEVRLAMDSLKQQLAETQRELEEKAAELLSRDGAAAVQANEDGPSVEEQIKGRVDEIQAELQKRHEDRVSQAETAYKSRVDAMRQQLSKKLGEGKIEISKKLEASHSEAVAKLQADHEKQITDLNQRHQEEVTELRKMTTNPDNNAASQSSTSNNDGGVQTSEFLLQLGESEIKKVLQEHEIARRIVTNSLKAREARMRDEQAKILEAKLAEAEAKARQVQEQAVAMEGKRLSVKMNMAENRARGALAKIEVVQQAATDTPDRAVSEVWDIAKVTKPAPAISASSNLNQSIHASPATPKTQATSAQAASSPTPQTAAAANTATEAPKPVEVSAAPTSTTTETAPSETLNGASSDSAQPAKPAPSTPALAQSAHASKPAETADKIADGKPKALDQPLSNPGQTRTRAGSQSGIPTAAGRGSGIPQPSGQRGGAAARGGRGRGGTGRGGAPGVNTAAAQSAGQQGGRQSASPRTMNPGAKQFVPNRKRNAEGAGLEGSVHAADNKRPKADG